MQLSDAAIEEYRRLYQQDFGEELTVQEAREVATRLLTLYELLSRPCSTPNVPGKRWYR